MEPLDKPTEDVSWEQVVAAVPDEAAALEAVLAAEDSSINEFCRDWPGCLSEESQAAWDHLSRAFEQTTGLKVEPTWEYVSEDSEDTQEGFYVLGAWQLSPAGKRFFGIKDKDRDREHAATVPDTGTTKRRSDAGWDEQVDCVRLDPDDDLVETVLIEQDTDWAEKDGRSHELPIRISMASGMLRVAAKGYGNGDTGDGYGHQVCVELYDGEFRLHAFPDIHKECPVTLSLEGAREGRRTRTVTIEIDYASLEEQTAAIGTVAVPEGVTGDDIRRLFDDWRDLAAGRKPDPDAGNDDEVWRWCEPGTDFEFLEWLVEKHGFRHFDGCGETLTLVW
jgi:hypothetical protein